MILQVMISLQVPNSEGEMFLLVRLPCIPSHGALQQLEMNNRIGPIVNMYRILPFVCCIIFSGWSQTQQLTALVDMSLHHLLLLQSSMIKLQLSTLLEIELYVPELSEGCCCRTRLLPYAYLLSPSKARTNGERERKCRLLLLLPTSRVPNFALI